MDDEEPWHVLGFNLDYVVWLGVETSLNERAVAAWKASPNRLARVFRKEHHAQHMVAWFLNEAAAAMLDAAGISWREHLDGTVACVPEDALCIIPVPVNVASR